MTIDEFLRQRPCLEELDGYLDALKPDSTTRASGAVLSHDTLTPEVLEKAKEYKERLLKGKVTPAPSALDRAYTYRFGRSPTRR